MTAETTKSPLERLRAMMKAGEERPETNIEQYQRLTAFAALWPELLAVVETANALPNPAGSQLAFERALVPLGNHIDALDAAIVREVAANEPRARSLRGSAADRLAQDVEALGDRIQELSDEAASAGVDLEAERERVERLRRWILTCEAYDSHEGTIQWDNHAAARAALQPGDLDEESE